MWLLAFQREAGKLWDLSSRKSLFQFKTIDDVLFENANLRSDNDYLTVALNEKKKIIEKGKQLLHQGEIALNDSLGQNELHEQNLKSMEEAIKGYQGDKSLLTSLVSNYSETVQKQATAIGDLHDVQGMLKSCTHNSSPHK